MTKSFQHLRLVEQREDETAEVSPIGRILKKWRRLRGLSQLNLALEAETSARHLSFIETGRARPSKGLVLRLGDALGIPLRARNEMLKATGFSPVFMESSLGDDSMNAINRALTAMLENHDPYPAMVLNGGWDIVMTNRSAALLVEAFGIASDGPLNAIKMVFDDQQLKPYIENWETVARFVLSRAMRELHESGNHDGKFSVVEEILANPNLPDEWRDPEALGDLPPVASLITRHGDLCLSWFSTISTFGTPQDVTLQETTIETLYPSDDITEAFIRKLAEV